MKTTSKKPLKNKDDLKMKTTKKMNTMSHKNDHLPQVYDCSLQPAGIFRLTIIQKYMKGVKPEMELYTMCVAL